MSILRSSFNRVQGYSQVEIGALQATGVVTSVATIDTIINGKNRPALSNVLITVVGKAVKVGETLAIVDTNEAATGTVQCATSIVGDEVTVNGLVYVAVAGAKANDTEFSIDTSDAATATDLADSIDDDVREAPPGYPVVVLSAAAVTDTVTITAAAGPDGNLVALESSDPVTLVTSGLLLTGGAGVDGLHPIVKVIDATHVVIDVPFTATVAGTYTMLGAKGFFAGFVPKGQVAGASITSIVFNDESLQQGDPTLQDYESGVAYMFPGIITEITLSADDMTLLRYSNNKPPTISTPSN